MLSKIKSLIAYAVLLATSDSDNFRIFTVEGANKKGNVTSVTPYGFDHNPPVGSLAVVWQIHGNEGNRVAMAFYPQKRKRGLALGEVAISNSLTGATIHLKANGDIDISSPGNMNVTCNNANVTASADVTVDAGGQINLGGNTLGVARVGDLVRITSGSSTGDWPIISGSGKVYAG